MLEAASAVAMQQGSGTGCRLQCCSAAGGHQPLQRTRGTAAAGVRLSTLGLVTFSCKYAYFLPSHHRIISCRHLYFTLFKQNSTVTIQKYELQRQVAAAEQEAARSPVSHTSCASASARPELGLAITSSLNRGNDIVAGE